MGSPPIQAPVLSANKQLHTVNLRKQGSINRKQPQNSLKNTDMNLLLNPIKVRKKQSKVHSVTIETEGLKKRIQKAILMAQEINKRYE